MSAITLESALKAHAASNRNAALLHAQWEFDHRLLTQALGSVGAWFPHYSLHDGSHSSTIVTQIERVLGPKRIEQLSPTDLWLILESAYWHDSGMLVSEPSARKLWLHEETRTRLESWRTSRDDERRENAQLLLAGPDLKNLEWPFEVRRRLILAISELRRPEHASMSGGLVRSPEDLGIDSPRTALIPRRLLELLARIVEGHGRSLAWVMQHLPQRESGLGADEAHPRLVACLLRIGDLLDLDDGRFCPTMGATFGALPNLSRAHERKHTSIQHLLVDSSRIEVTAVCGDFESYEVTSQWLSMLADEIKSQAGQWSDISSGSSFGALPSAGAITARIQGGITLPNGARPRFHVDPDAVRELAKGTNLYSESSAFVRELLQNAVDATQLRMYAESRSEIDPGSKRPINSFKGSPLQWMRDKLKEYAIDVRVVCSSSQTEPGKNVDVSVTIHDQGTGIARSDLAHLLTVMSGKSGPEKERNRAGMPEWLWPSGAFGIGLQSVFLVANSLKLDTFHFDTLERTSITLRSDGSVEAREGTRDARASFGTTASFKVSVPLAGRFMVTDYAQQWMDEVDPVMSDTHPHPPLVVGAWLDAIQAFARTTTVPINWSFSNNGREIASSSSYVSENTEPTWTLWLDDQDRLSCVRFFSEEKDGVGMVSVLYRGAAVLRRDVALYDLPCRVSIDFYFGTARELLTMDRTSLSIEGKRVLEEEVVEALKRKVDSVLMDEPDSVPTALQSSLALSAKVRNRTSRIGDWRDFRVEEVSSDSPSTGNRKDAALSTIVSGEKVALCRKGGRPAVWCDGKLYLAGGAVADALAMERPRRDKFSWGTLLSAGAPQVTASLQHGLKVFATLGNRRLVTTPSRYAGLSIERSSLVGWSVWGAFHRFEENEALMLSPFVGRSAVGFRFDETLRPHRLVEYVRWTAKHSASKASEAEVARLAWLFICEVANLRGMADRGLSSLDDARRELSTFSTDLPDWSTVKPEEEDPPPWHGTGLDLS